jgi:iron complex transport system substrate-binding protein
MQRRDFVAAGGATLAGVLAGCAGGSGEQQSTVTGTATGGPYTVSIEPVGEVTFDSVPQTWVGNNGSWADMGVALGVGAPEAVWLPGRYHTNYYDDIPSVSVDGSSITALSDDGVGEEQFYALDGDVHVIDPNFLRNRFDGWDEEKVNRVAERQAPFFANSSFSRNYAWHESYRYYTIEECFEKLSQVFQRQDRYEAMMDVRETFSANLSAAVPEDDSERPNVAVLWGGDDPEQFYPYLINEGTSYRQLRDLQVGDALAQTDVQDFYESRGQIGYETLLEIDPDVLLIRSHEDETPAEFESNVVSFMESDDTASELTAVQNGDVYRGGPLYQGPITNMVVAERQAQQLYDVDGSLFDRQRVGEIVDGNL